MSVRGRGAPRRARVRLVLLGALFLVLVLRRADLFGDRGMSNVVTALGGLLAALGALVWFVLHGTLALRARLALLAAVLLSVAGFFVLFRVEGVSGELVPELAWRFGARTGAPPLAAAGATRPVDLVPTSAADFPAFLGARRDQTLSGPALARDWVVRPPRLRWREPCGAGWSAFALVNGWGVTLEQDESGQRVSARDLATGALAWSTRIDDAFEHVLGGAGPRSTPAIDQGRVYAQSAWARLVCLDGTSGALLWQHDLLAEYGVTRADETEHVQYGRSGSPLVTDTLVIVPAGGAADGRQAGLVAFDKRTGVKQWESPARQVSYSSPARATLCGGEQFLIVNEASLSGHDPASGRLLWEHPWPGRTSGDANASQALGLAPDRVFVSKGYGGGGLLLRLVPRADGELAAEELWHDRRLLRTKFTNVVLQRGFVYGLDDGTLECVELDTGVERWKEGRYEHGQLLLVGELLLLLSEEGEVFLLQPDPARPNAVLGSFQALTGKCWANLALAGELLVLRNAEECAAWELPLER